MRLSAATNHPRRYRSGADGVVNDADTITCHRGEAPFNTHSLGTAILST
jgi:hypothetical protein